MPYESSSGPRLGDVYRNSARSMLDEFEERRRRENNPTGQEQQQQNLDRFLQIGTSLLPIAGTAVGAGVGGAMGGPAGAMAGMGIGGAMGTAGRGVGQELIAMQPHQEQQRKTREEEMLRDALKARMMSGYA